VTARRVLTPEEEYATYLPRALRAVRELTVAWNPKLGDAGGFQWADGRPINPPLLITLWKARDRGLLCVDGSVVLLTVKGAAS
jgi:hypothetical protein